MKPLASKCKVDFYRGNALGPEGLDKEPMASLEFKDMIFVDLDVVYKMSQTLREYVNDNQGEFCTFKISFEDIDV